jgi:hypothetical protein
VSGLDPARFSARVSACPVAPHIVDRYGSRVADLRSVEQISTLLAHGSRLKLAAGTAEVLRSFEAAGVQARLLKGASFESWLHASGEPRMYLDCDLLIPPGELGRAEHVLSSLSLERHFDDRRMPSWWREHASVWVRKLDGLTVDLHRTMPGVGVDEETAWRILSGDPDLVEVAGFLAPTLALPARALHVVLHAAQHGIGWERPMADLERALAAGDDDLWRNAAALADQLFASDSFVTGLRLAPAGASLADRLGLPGAGSVEARLRATTPPPIALGFEQLARADGMRARAAVVLRKVVPPPTFVRHWDPRAADSRAALLRAYARRPLWLLRQAPKGFFAWRRVRRSTRAPARR